MCLIAFAWNTHPRWRLVLLGNRDEMHARPTAPLARWPGKPILLAGKDLEAGGTWMGLGEHGRAAVVTNVRDPAWPADGRSRGYLVRDFLQGQASAREHGEALLAEAASYRPFNLLLFDETEAVYLGNHPAPHLEIAPPGVHGLSNADFNTPWPKTARIKERLQSWVDQADDDLAPLWPALADAETWPDEMLPDTGVGIELERMLSAAFIRGERYGTRASTLLAINRDGSAAISERRFGPRGVAEGETTLELPATARD